MKHYLFLAFIFCFTGVCAQQVLKGTISDAATGDPLAGVTVYINNSSHGTTTNTTGDFILNDIPPGRQTLIISSIGYATKSIEIDEKDYNHLLTIHLQQKSKELTEVTVGNYEKDGWEKWGQSFITNFIGRSVNGRKTVLKNKNVLKFRFNRKTNTLTVIAIEPLIIENNGLGYTIQYDLQEYTEEFNTRIVSYNGYSLYKEKDARESKTAKWKTARQKAYYGSITHFIKSVYNNSLAKDSFEVRRLRKEPNYERQRVSQIVRQRALNNDQNSAFRNSGSTRSLKDSTAYYDYVLKQPNEIEIFGRDLLTADSICFTDEPSRLKYIQFNDFLYIIYKKEKEEREYLEANGENRRPYYQRSFIYLSDNTPAQILSNGNFYPPTALINYGYWGWEKIGESLPLDYEITEEN